MMPSQHKAILVEAASKQLAAEIALFEAACWREDQAGMQTARENARNVLDAMLDLKLEQFRMVVGEVFRK